MCVCVQEHACTDVRGKIGCLEASRLSNSLLLNFELSKWPSSSSSLPVSPSTSSWVPMQPHSGFCVSAGDLNSGHHDGTGSVLTQKQFPSPCPKDFY